MGVVLVKSAKIGQLEILAPGIDFKDAITFPKSEKMTAGYFKINPCTTETTLDIAFEEIEYLIEGSATYSDETGSKYTAKKGDFICLRKGSKVSISSEKGCEGIYVVYPYNWKELLSMNEKS